MKGELTKYAYEEEPDLIEAYREDFDAGRVHFVYDEDEKAWRKVTTG